MKIWKGHQVITRSFPLSCLMKMSHEKTYKVDVASMIYTNSVASKKGYTSEKRQHRFFWGELPLSPTRSVWPSYSRPCFVEVSRWFILGIINRSSDSSIQLTTDLGYGFISLNIAGNHFQEKIWVCGRASPECWRRHEKLLVININWYGK